MSSAAGWLTQQHDQWLVAAAVLAFILATTTSMRLLNRSGASGPKEHPMAWITPAAMGFSFGVWTMHFRAMLAYSPGLPSAIGQPRKSASGQVSS